MTKTILRERDLPFCNAMARAWVEGRKRQTRRVMRVEKMKNHEIASVHQDGSGLGWIAWSPNLVSAEETRRLYPGHEGFACPYGAPGDTLVLTGEWATSEVLDAMPGSLLTSRAKHWTIYDSPEKPTWCGRTRLPRYVPKHLYGWFPRTPLELVRAQRVKDISEDDAVAEGCCYTNGSAVLTFRNLWDSINAKRKGGIYAWAKSPWAWALTIGGPDTTKETKP